MTQLTHKGYTATIEADPDTGIIHGEARKARALLSFAGCSMDEAKAAFMQTIADYEDWCRKRDKAPETPRSRIARRKALRRGLAPAKI
jgi:predicted HicB family RNase H-like nuclease